MRVRFIKDYKNWKKGDTIEVSRNVAFGLTDGGLAIISKDLVAKEYKTKHVKTKR